MIKMDGPFYGVKCNFVKQLLSSQDGCIRVRLSDEELMYIYDELFWPEVVLNKSVAGKPNLKPGSTTKDDVAERSAIFKSDSAKNATHSKALSESQKCFRSRGFTDFEKRNSRFKTRRRPRHGKPRDGIISFPKASRKKHFLSQLSSLSSSNKPKKKKSFGNTTPNRRTNLSIYMASGTSKSGLKMCIRKCNGTTARELANTPGIRRYVNNQHMPSSRGTPVSLDNDDDGSYPCVQNSSSDCFENDTGTSRKSDWRKSSAQSEYGNTWTFGDLETDCINLLNDLTNDSSDFQKEYSNLCDARKSETTGQESVLDELRNDNKIDKLVASVEHLQTNDHNIKQCTTGTAQNKTESLPNKNKDIEIKNSECLEKWTEAGRQDEDELLGKSEDENNASDSMILLTDISPNEVLDMTTMTLCDEICEYRPYDETPGAEGLENKASPGANDPKAAPENVDIDRSKETGDDQCLKTLLATSTARTNDENIGFVHQNDRRRRVDNDDLIGGKEIDGSKKNPQRSVSSFESMSPNVSRYDPKVSENEDHRTPTKKANRRLHTCCKEKRQDGQKKLEESYRLPHYDDINNDEFRVFSERSLGHITKEATECRNSLGMTRLSHMSDLYRPARRHPTNFYSGIPEVWQREESGMLSNVPGYSRPIGEDPPNPNGRWTTGQFPKPFTSPYRNMTGYCDGGIQRAGLVRWQSDPIRHSCVSEQTYTNEYFMQHRYNYCQICKAERETYAMTGYPRPCDTSIKHVNVSVQNENICQRMMYEEKGNVSHGRSDMSSRLIDQRTLPSRNIASQMRSDLHAGNINLRRNRDNGIDKFNIPVLITRRSEAMEDYVDVGRFDSSGERDMAVASKGTQETIQRRTACQSYPISSCDIGQHQPESNCNLSLNVNANWFRSPVSSLVPERCAEPQTLPHHSNPAYDHSGFRLINGRDTVGDHTHQIYHQPPTRKFSKTSPPQYYSDGTHYSPRDIPNEDLGRCQIGNSNMTIGSEKKSSHVGERQHQWEAANRCPSVVQNENVSSTTLLQNESFPKTNKPNSFSIYQQYMNVLSSSYLLGGEKAKKVDKVKKRKVAAQFVGDGDDGVANKKKLKTGKKMGKNKKEQYSSKQMNEERDKKTNQEDRVEIRRNSVESEGLPKLINKWDGRKGGFFYLTEVAVSSENQLIFITCTTCDKVALYLCSGCRTVAFCSRKCQELSWETHKDQCLRKRQEVLNQRNI